MSVDGPRTVIEIEADYTVFTRAIITADTITNNVRLPGQYYDSETGLAYNYYRTYDPAIGRFVESDPTGLWGGLNTYGYSLDDPINQADPYGLASSNIGEPYILGPPTDVFVPGTPRNNIFVNVTNRLLNRFGNNLRNNFGHLMSPGNSGRRKRGNSDPIGGKKPFNPGRDCNDECNACPEPEIWEAPGNAHGSAGGTHYHGLIWNQDPSTCMCFPKRVSGSSPDDLR